MFHLFQFLSRYEICQYDLLALNENRLREGPSRGEDKNTDRVYHRRREKWEMRSPETRMAGQVLDGQEGVQMGSTVTCH